MKFTRLFLLSWFLGLAIAGGPDKRPIPQSVIREILELKPTDAIPASIFEKYDDRTIAESLIERLYRLRFSDEVGPTESQIRVWNETQLHRWVHGDNLWRSFANGFKNGIATQSRYEEGYISNRLSKESKVIQLSLSGSHKHERAVELLPKYGAVYFNKKSYSDQRSTPNVALDYYGETIVVFKDDVKKRSTWIWGAHVTHGEAKLEDRFKSGKPFWINRDNEDITRYTDATGKPEPAEFHVWGPLDMQDVEAVLVSEKTSANSLEFLERSGLPVRRIKYYQESLKKGSSDHYKAYEVGETVFEPDQNKWKKFLKIFDEKSLEYLELMKPMAKDVSQIMTAMRMVLPKIKTAEDFLKLTEPGLPKPSTAYSNELKAFSREKMGIFLSFSPTQKQIDRLMSRYESIEGIANHITEAFKSVQTIEQFYLVLRHGVEKPSDAMLSRMRSLYDLSVPTFVKLNPTLEEVWTFLQKSISADANLRIRTAFLNENGRKYVTTLEDLKKFWASEAEVITDYYRAGLNRLWSYNIDYVMSMLRTTDDVLWLAQTYSNAFAEYTEKIKQKIGKSMMVIDGHRQLHYIVGLLHDGSYMTVPYSHAQKVAQASIEIKKSSELFHTVPTYGTFESDSRVASISDNQPGRIVNLFENGVAQVRWKNENESYLSSGEIDHESAGRKCSRLLSKISPW